MVLLKKQAVVSSLDVSGTPGVTIFCSGKENSKRSSDCPTSTSVRAAAGKESDRAFMMLLMTSEEFEGGEEVELISQLKVNSLEAGDEL